MGAKKTGLTDTEYGKELFVAVAKLERPKAEAKVCREKVTMDLELDRETKISICDDTMQDIYTTIVACENGKTIVRVILSNTYMGHGYYLLTESTDKELKKKVFVETNR